MLWYYTNKVTCFRKGASLALGALPLFMLRGQFGHVLSGLVASLHFTTKAEEKMADARRDAIKSISR